MAATEVEPQTSGASEFLVKLANRADGGFYTATATMYRTNLGTAGLPRTGGFSECIPVRASAGVNLSILFYFQSNFVSWPSLISDGYELEFADGMQNPIQWQMVTADVRVLQGRKNYLFFTQPAGQTRYYRLRQP